MPFFRKKPVIVEAVRFIGGSKSADEIFAFCPSSIWNFNHNTISIDTLEGTMVANPGDWIIKGVKGEYYPCKPDIFDATYENVNPHDVDEYYKR